MLGADRNITMSLHPRGESWPHVQETPGGWPPSPTTEPKSAVISAPHSIFQALKARRSEFIKKKTLKIKVGTWNVAARSGTEKDLGEWFVGGKGIRGLSETLVGLPQEPDVSSGATHNEIESIEEQEARRSKKASTVPRNDSAAVPAGDEIDLYVLGLQEIVDIGSATEALRSLTDPTPSKKWARSLEAVLPQGYQKVAEQQLQGLLSLVYASPSVIPFISSVSATSVGTGLMGYMGNKGAVSVRVLFGETTKLVFINCHLAAGTEKAALDRRNWDVSQILSRTRFEPVTIEEETTEEVGDGIGDEDFAFWFGDLNYRLDDIPGEDVRRLLLLHTRNEYDQDNKSKRDIDSELGHIHAHAGTCLPAYADATHEDEVDETQLDPKSDPASLHTTLQSLLPHDQLRSQQKLRKAFHDGWREGDINFLPTYKYDIGSAGMFDSGEKRRGPSWCDRILYRSRRDRLGYDQRVKEQEKARGRDADMKKRGLDNAAFDEDVFFEYNPDTDGLAYGDNCDEYDEQEDAEQRAQSVETREEYEDAISLDHYSSHQRVLSSDHKPLDATFTLVYDAVIPELKAKVHQDVVRRIDKAENEGRPGVALVVDNHSEDSMSSADDSTERPDMNGVDFGEVRYGVVKTRGLTIANTGAASATFCFIDRPVPTGQKTGIMPPWLNLRVDRPSNNANSNVNAVKEYTLAPGDSAYVVLTLDISDLDLVHDLNDGNVEVEDVLVLRIRDGRDHFVPLRGSWMWSCFSRTLDELVLIPEGGIRELQRRHQQQSRAVNNADRQVASSANEASSNRLSAPRELFALTEAISELAERCLAEWEMTNGDKQPPWRVTTEGFGWPFDARTWTLQDEEERSRLLASVRETLDTSSSIGNLFNTETPFLIRLEVLAETILTFLHSLRDGIITASLWTEIESQQLLNEKSRIKQTNEEVQAWVLEVLSSNSVHSVAFSFLTFMLAKVANEIAPPPRHPVAMTRSPRLSSSSMLSVSSENEAPVLPSATSSGKASVLSCLRRRTRTSTSSTGDSSNSVPDAVRRRAVEHSYSSIFADAMIRSGTSATYKERDRKALHDRKRGVLEVFLSAPS